jgi:hypothetical protein
MKQPPWLLQDSTLTLSCHVQPGARKTCLSGLHDERLKIQLKAPPVDGKANKMLVEYLSKLCDRPRSEIAICRGESSRFKTIRINGMQEIPQQIMRLQKE